jgi:hypothetical protein
MATYAGLTNSLIILQLLSNFEHRDWNLDHVRESIVFVDVLDKLIERLIAIRPEQTDYFSRTARKLEIMKAFCEGKMSTFEQAIQAVHDPEWVRPDPAVEDDMMDLIDDEWMGDLFGNWDIQFGQNVDFGIASET